jgi:2-methylcitrate dehydratase PrpD
MTETLSLAASEWIIATSYDTLPSAIKVEARKALTNSVGTAIGAFPLVDAQTALSYAKDQGSSGPATVLADGARLGTGLAAFTNGVLFNHLGQEETHLRSGTHPAETTIPVVLALAEKLGSSGKEVLEAVTIGIEITVSFARMKLTPDVKYDLCESPAVYGTLGAAAAAAKLLRLDQQQTAHALGLAANFAAGLSECIRMGTDEYHFIVALASQHGELAAQLASRGAIAARLAFEGEGGFYHLFAGVSREALAAHDVVADVRGRLGSEWALPELIYKPYPVNYFNQVFADGALTLRNRHAIDPSGIRLIRITVGQLAGNSGARVAPPYKTRGGVLGSTRFCVASILARGTLGLADTLDLDAPDIRALMDRTEVIVESGLTNCIVEVTTGDGTFTFDGDTEGRDYRLRPEEIESIFRVAAGAVLPEPQVELLLVELKGIEDATSISRLMELSILGADK